MYKIRFVLNGLFIFIFIVLVLESRIRAQEAPETPSSGKELFIKNRCSRCHTIGRGRFVGPDLAGVGGRYGKDEIGQWMENPQEIYSARGKSPVNEGYPPMPPLGVPPGEAEAIADYLLSVKTSPSQNAEGGVIKGRVVNETSQEGASGIELTLTAFLGERPTDEKKTTTSDGGLFEFRELPWNRSYAVSVNYDGTQYVTDKMVFDPEEDAKTLDLPIYEPTESDRDISVNAAHMIVQISDEKLAVAEIMVFHNGSRKIYVGKNGLQDGKRETLRFSLPEGASDVEYLTGLTSESVLRTEQGFIDTSGFEPGIRRAVYAYTLPYKSGGNVFEKTVNYPTQGFALLVSDSSNKVKVDGLSGGDVEEIQGGRFLKWTGDNLKPGAKIRIEIVNPLLDGDPLKWVVLGAVAIMIGGSILYSFVIKNKKETVEKDNGLSITDDLEQERKNLIREIAELDDKFEANGIGEEEYKLLRAQKKDRLVEISRTIKKP